VLNSQKPANREFSEEKSTEPPSSTGPPNAPGSLVGCAALRARRGRVAVSVAVTNRTDTGHRARTPDPVSR